MFGGAIGALGTHFEFSSLGAAARGWRNSRAFDDTVKLSLSWRLRRLSDNGVGCDGADGGDVYDYGRHLSFAVFELLLLMHGCVSGCD